MLQDIDIHELSLIKERDPEIGAIIDTLLANHKRIISTISHEIRNPLTLVYSSLQLIQSQNPEVRNLKFWDSTIDEILFMKQLLEELSTFNNSNTLKWEIFDLSQLLDHISLSFSSVLQNSNIQFVSNISTLPSKITGDTIKLQEVITNIIKNACDAIDHSGSVYMHAYTQDAYIIITISDTGCGITSEKLDTIFEPFVTYKSNGTGLGLAIAKQIMEAHNGSIDVCSSTTSCLSVDFSSDIRTMFTLRFPIEQNA